MVGHAVLYIYFIYLSFDDNVTRVNEMECTKLNVIFHNHETRLVRGLKAISYLSHVVK